MFERFEVTVAELRKRHAGTRIGRSQLNPEVPDLSDMSREDAAEWLAQHDQQERFLKHDLAALMGHLHPDDMMKELSLREWNLWREWLTDRRANG